MTVPTKEKICADGLIIFRVVGLHRVTGQFLVTREKHATGNVLRIAAVYGHGNWTFDLNEVCNSYRGQIQISKFEIDRTEGDIILARFTEEDTPPCYFTPRQLTH